MTILGAWMVFGFVFLVFPAATTSRKAMMILGVWVLIFWVVLLVFVASTRRGGTMTISTGVRIYGRFRRLNRVILELLNWLGWELVIGSGCWGVSWEMNVCRKDACCRSVLSSLTLAQAQ